MHKHFACIGYYYLLEGITLWMDYPVTLLLLVIVPLSVADTLRYTLILYLIGRIH